MANRSKEKERKGIKRKIYVVSFTVQVYKTDHLLQKIKDAKKSKESIIVLFKVTN